MGTQALWCAQSSAYSCAAEQNGPASVNRRVSPFEEAECEGQAILGTPRKRVPIGPDFQAELPRLVSVNKRRGLNIEKHEPDSPRWLGECVWSLQEHECFATGNVSKTHPARCSCAIQDAVECVRLHIEEEREALKNELGLAFYAWGFDEMGETVTEHWTCEEELTFQGLVRKNPLSFWYKLFKAFPSRCTRELVSYYFNVFVLRKRAIQNRLNPGNIDSDDDELVLDSEDEDSASLCESEEAEESQVDDAASKDDEADDSSGHAPDSGDETNTCFGESSLVVETAHMQENHGLTKTSSRICCPQHSNMADEKQPLNLISDSNHETRNQGERIQAMKTWDILPWDQPTDCSSNQVEGKPEQSCVAYSTSERQALGDCSACKEGFFVNSHQCVLDQCDSKVWDTPSLLSSQKDVDKLISTKGMMEEFFGAESSEGTK